MNARALFLSKRNLTMAGAVALALMLGAFSDRAWAIAGGEPDDGRHPYVCAMIAEHPVFGLLPFSGTLIHPRVILTAGHTACVIASGGTLYGVSFDEQVVFAEPGSWLEASGAVCGGYITRPGADAHQVDIGAIILKEPVTGITPATLPTLGFLDSLKDAHQLTSGPDGTRLIVVGYGCDMTLSPPEIIFPEGEVTRNLAQCGYLGLDAAWVFMNENQAAGYGSAVLGDSGGPTFYIDPETGDEVLIAITSWGSARVGVGISYRVDTEESLQFIHDVIDSLEQE